jgi:hypothetical protein
VRVRVRVCVCVCLSACLSVSVSLSPTEHCLIAMTAAIEPILNSISQAILKPNDSDLIRKYTSKLADEKSNAVEPLRLKAYVSDAINCVEMISCPKIECGSLSIYMSATVCLSVYICLSVSPSLTYT